MSTKQNTLKASPASAYEISVVTDGTRTLVEIVAFDDRQSPTVIGRGLARRRRGEKRDEGVGQLVAFRRAFADALGHIDERLADLGKKGWADAPKKKKVDNLDEDSVKAIIKKAKEYLTGEK